MKIMKLTIVAIALSSLGFLAFGSLESLEQKKISTTQHTVTKNNALLKKWNLSHYELFGADFDTETNEKKDYVYFQKGGMYSSVSQGVFEKGNYTLDEQDIIMTNSTEKGKLKFVIKNLTETTLSVSIDDPEDSDAQYLTIHFKNK
jgi:hypothetical protein|tara:strand:+ start:3244 stop:3681 length:438 start_codon:yes stop_codon:yes gene_type:complete